MRIFVFGVLLLLFGGALLSQAFNNMTLMIGSGALVTGGTIVGVLLWNAFFRRKVIAK